MTRVLQTENWLIIIVFYTLVAWCEFSMIFFQYKKPGEVLDFEQKFREELQKLKNEKEGDVQTCVVSWTQKIHSPRLRINYVNIRKHLFSFVRPINVLLLKWHYCMLVYEFHFIPVLYLISVMQIQEFVSLKYCFNYTQIF